MKYVIDANNLAGKLDLLQEESFDSVLIEKVMNLFSNNSCHVVLVFDSVDPMGDKYKKGNIEIIYTPRDNYYLSADDKILELIQNEDTKEEIVAVTDDRELADKIEEKNEQVTIKKATDFSKKMENQEETEEDLDKDQLTDEEVKDINRELLDKFKNQ